MRRPNAVEALALGGALAVLLAAAHAASAADPGLFIPTTTEASDLRHGNVLFYNVMTSNALDPASEDTRLTITNHSAQSARFVRLFFVEGASGLVASSFICLTAEQTASFQASDLLPGFRGFMIAVQIDPTNGCPQGDASGGFGTGFLSGQAHVKSGIYQGTLPAVAATALFNGQLPGCDLNSTTANLSFNGVLSSGYTRLPRMLQIDNVGAPTDGERTLVVLNRTTGDLGGSGVSALGPLSGTLFDAAGTALPFTRSPGGAQLFRELDNKFPKTTPKFRTAIPSGQTGWAKLNLVSDIPLMGAAFFRPGGAVNLRARTLSASGGFTMPVDPPSC